MAQTDEKKDSGGGGFLYSLIKRITLFCLLFLAVMLLLYFSGNFQAFQDSSLRIILFCSSLTAVMLLLSSAVGVFASLVLALVRRKPGQLMAAAVFLLLGTAACAVFISLRGLSVLTAGIQ